jgi:Ca2+-binding RTX toxin-like protein
MAGFDAIITGSQSDDLLDGHLYPATFRLLFRGLGGNDRINSTNPNNYIDAGAGNDLITSIGGTVNAGSGNDEVNITGSHNAIIRDGAGSDHVFISMAKAARATVNADTTDATGDDWYIVNNTGATARLSYATAPLNSILTIDARSGIASSSAIGTDHFSGFSEIIGGNFNNNIYANDSGMRIWGGIGDNFIWGGAGNDIIYGKGKYNIIEDKTGGVINIHCGTRTSYGPNTNDYITVSSTSGGIVDVGADRGYAKITIDDSVTGLSKKLTVYMGNGTSELVGNDAFETVFVGQNSTNIVNLGANGIIYVNHNGLGIESFGDSLDLFRSTVAGSLNETISYADTYLGIELGAGVPGQFLAKGLEIGQQMIIGIEKIIGGHGNDLFASHGDDFVSFTGNAGDDRFTSNQATRVGTTSISGGSGNDTMEGGTGYDRIELGDGINLATGGLGHDDFCFNTDRTAIAGNTQTTITDFEDGIDKIRLGGDLTKDYFLAHLAQVDGNVVFSDGSGDTLTLSNILISQLNASDFILV